MMKPCNITPLVKWLQRSPRYIMRMMPRSLMLSQEVLGHPAYTDLLCELTLTKYWETKGELCTEALKMLIENAEHRSDEIKPHPSCEPKLVKYVEPSHALAMCMRWLEGPVSGKAPYINIRIFGGLLYAEFIHCPCNSLEPIRTSAQVSVYELSYSRIPLFDYAICKTLDRLHLESTQ